MADTEFIKTFAAGGGTVTLASGGVVTGVLATLAIVYAVK